MCKSYIPDGEEANVHGILIGKILGKWAFGRWDARILCKLNVLYCGHKWVQRIG